jgi:hypothetical protein
MPFNSASDAFQLHPDVAQVTAGPNAGRSAGVVAELDAKKIDRNYVTRARWLFFWSIVIPVCAMSFFMSETFKKEWAGPTRIRARSRRISTSFARTSTHGA